MSRGKTNINKTIILNNAADPSGSFSACTEINTNKIVTCTGDTLTIDNNVLVSGVLSATTYYGDGSYLSGITSDNFFLTGVTFTGNELTSTLNNGDVIVTEIDNFSGLTINGTINSNVPNTGVILNSFNTSASNASQFVIEHSSGNVTIRNDRSGSININPNLKTNIGGVNSLGCADITLDADTIITGEFVHHASSTPTADACLIDNSISFHMDGNSLAGQYKNNLGAVNPIEFGSATNVLGIADSNGVYTYYSDYASAITAASVGGTIEQFGDIVETGSVTLNISKSLTIQMNGYSYTLDNIDNTYAVYITGNDLNINILNGKINRINGVASRTIECGSSTTNRSIICFDGTTIFTDLDDTRSLLGTSNNTTITGGVWRSESAGGTLSVIVDTDCTLTNFIYEGTGYVSSYRSRSVVSNGTINSSHPSHAFFLNGVSCKGNNLTIRNTVGEGVYSVGSLTNCNVYSEGNDAIRMGNGAVTDNCYGYSTAGAGLYVGGGVVSNSQGYSTSTFGMHFDGRNSPKGINCKGWSSAATGIRLFSGSNGVTLTNCYAESTLDTTAGHAIECSSAPSNLKLINCTVKTTNAGANGISTGGSGYVTGLVPIGMTTAINAGFTLTQDDTHIVTGLVQHAPQTAIVDSDLIENSINFHMDGSALAGRYKDNLGVTTDIEFRVSVDIIEVIRDGDLGVPTYFNDLQTALDTCKTGSNIVNLRGNITLSSFLDITGTFSYDSLTVNGNGFKILFDNTGTDDAIKLSVSNSKTHFSNLQVIRLNGTGTHHAIEIFSTDFTSSQCYFYCENSRAAWFQDVFNKSSLGGSVFESDGGDNTITFRNFNMFFSEFTTISNGTGAAIDNWSDGVISRFNAINTSTGIAYKSTGAAVASEFYASSTIGTTILDSSGKCIGVIAESVSGVVYDGRNIKDFNLKTGNNTAMNIVLGSYINGYIENNSSSVTGYFNTPVEVFNVVCVNKGAGYAFDLNNTLSAVNDISGVVATSYGGIGGHIRGSAGDVANSTFISKLDTTSGHSVTLGSNGHKISDCFFRVKNIGANNIYASAARTATISNCTFDNATLPINANITVGGLTTDAYGNITI